MTNTAKKNAPPLTIGPWEGRSIKDLLTRNIGLEGFPTPSSPATKLPRIGIRVDHMGKIPMKLDPLPRPTPTTTTRHWNIDTNRWRHQPDDTPGCGLVKGELNAVLDRITDNMSVSPPIVSVLDGITTLRGPSLIKTACGDPDEKPPQLRSNL